MVFEEFNVDRSLSDLDEIPELVENVPVGMGDLLVFIALEDEMVEKLETLLECQQMFLVYFFLLLLLQQIKVSLK